MNNQEKIRLSNHIREKVESAKAYIECNFIS